MTRNPDASSTIVIPLVAGIGNALMTEPMLRQLRIGRPDARIVAIAISKPIAEVARRIDGVEVQISGSGIKNLLRSIRTVRGLSPDVYLVPFPSNRWQYNLLASASGAKEVVIHGYPKPAIGLGRFNRVPAVRGIHDVIQNLRLLPALDIQPDEQDQPQFPLTDADQDKSPFDDSLSHLAGQPFVIMHAGSAQTVLAEAKRWPASSYAALAMKIRQETSLPVVIVEGPDEQGIGQAIAQACQAPYQPHCLRLAGTLGQSAAVIARASFYVGTDSGLAHLAAAVGKPAITLFAPADPDRVCPYGQRHLVVQPEGLGDLAFLYPWESTRPRLRPGRVDDIKRITPGQVMEKVRAVAGDLGRNITTPPGQHR